MSQLLANQIKNYEKSINKAINNPDMEVKEKYVRLVIMGTFLEKGAEMFWRVALGFPYTNNKVVAWKFCYVLHKVLMEGHSLCCNHSQNHKIVLERIGKTWYHSDEGFPKIIQMYAKLLAAKLEFHFHYPGFPGHLNVTLSELELIVKNDMSDYFQLSVDILEYLNHVIQFQESIFQSAFQGKKASICASVPLYLSIQEASQLYNHCVRILFILHSSLPTESLQGHRIRFGKQFRRLKSVYSNAKMFYMFTVPSLPEKPPDFFIEANLPSLINLEGLESSRLSCIDLVDITAINSSQNMLNQQITIPKSNEVVEGNLIDLSDSSPFHQVNHSRSAANCSFLPASQQMRIEKVPSLKNKDVVDLLGMSLSEFCQRPTEQPPLPPVIHQIYIENMIVQQSKAEENPFLPVNTSSHTPLSSIFPQVQPELRSTGDLLNSNMQMTNTFPQRSNLIEENFSNQFEYNGDCRPSAPPLSSTVTDHQIHIEAIIERDNHIQYLQHELEKLRQENYRMESDNFKNFQEKVASLEKSLFAEKENEAVQENKIKMLINQVPSSPQYRSECSSSVLENNNSKNFKEKVTSLEKSLFAEKENKAVQENQVKMLINQVPNSPQNRSDHSSSVLENNNFKNFQDKVTSLEKFLFAKENEAEQQNQSKMLVNQVPSIALYRSVRSSSVYESNNSKDFQDKVTSLEKSLFAEKENKAIQENQVKMLINQVPNSPQNRSDHSSSVLENNNFKNFQDKVTSLEKSLFAKENEAEQENKIKMLVNQVPSSTQYRSERASSVLENNNSKNFSEVIEERQSTDEQVGFAFQATSSDSDDWDDEDEIDEVQNGIENLELEDKIRDIEQQIDLHMKNKYLEVWDNNQELYNIKTEILKMSLENLIKKKQTDVAESEEKVKKKNLINRKFKKVTSFWKDKKMKLKG